jgi:hypothetical protein
VGARTRESARKPTSRQLGGVTAAPTVPHVCNRLCPEYSSAIDCASAAVTPSSTRARTTERFTIRAIARVLKP